jgi:hypothetical protein
MTRGLWLRSTTGAEVIDWILSPSSGFTGLRQLEML